jgi:hypothetical protein
MRVLGSTVLAVEAIIVMLATLVAANSGAVASPGLAYALGGILMVALIATIGVVSRPAGIIIGWVLQIAILAFGFVVPVMWFIGAIFLALWWLAVRNGTRVDRLRAERASTMSDPDEMEPNGD